MRHGTDRVQGDFSPSPAVAQHGMARRVPTALAPLPALALGMGVMRASGVPTAQWAVNLGATAVGLACFAVLARLPAARLQTAFPWISAAAVTLLVATLVFPGLEGVRRWVPVGPLRANASEMASPVLVAFMAHSLGSPRLGRAIGFALCAQLFHLVQPDAGQCTASAEPR